MPTVKEMQARHTAAVAVLQRAVAGETLSADEKTEATDMLAGLAEIISRDTNLPVGEPVLHYDLYHVTQVVKRRNAGTAEKHASPAPEAAPAAAAASARDQAPMLNDNPLRAAVAAGRARAAGAGYGPQGH